MVCSMRRRRFLKLSRNIESDVGVFDDLVPPAAVILESTLHPRTMLSVIEAFTLGMTTEGDDTKGPPVLTQYLDTNPQLSVTRGAVIS